MRVAVADVGTNSTHLLVAEIQGDHYHVLDALKIRTRLGECLGEDGHMTEEGERRLREALAQFAELAKALDVTHLRVYATSALREAPNGPEIAERVKAATGLYPAIISGEREGRLTYLGASHSVNFGPDNLLLDLGGGSLEIVRGGGETVSDVISLPLGGIRMQDRFLHRDPPKNSEYKTMVAYLRGALEPLVERFGAAKGTQAVFSSGTAEDIALAIAERRGEAPTQANGLSFERQELGGLLRDLRKMTEAERGHIAAFSKRARIIVAAASVLHTAMEVLGIERAVVSEGALREGMLIEEMQQQEHYVAGLSARQRSALALAERFRVDLGHARQVVNLSADLFTRLQGAEQKLPEGGLGLLRAAATLHEAGQIVAQSGHHKHSAYLIRHGGLRGFDAGDIELIAQIARYHRRSLPHSGHENYHALSKEDQRLVRQMAAILRVADGLDRSYSGGVSLRELKRGKRGKRGWTLSVCGHNMLDRSGAGEKADLWEAEFGPLTFDWLSEEDCEG